MKFPEVEEKRNELLALVPEIYKQDECFEVEFERALWWICNNFHAGQNDILYAVLSQSPYTPGILEKSPDECQENDLATDIYFELAEHIK